MSDLISRQAAIEVCDWWQHEYDESASRIDDIIHCIAEDIEKLPSADVPHWIPCSERLPERIINGDVETVQEFFVTVKERWPGGEWKYYTDVAEFPGDYIDDVWQTYNDWKEGQEVHVIAWMPLPEPYKGVER